MESKNPTRFTLGKQSSLAPESDREEAEVENDESSDIDPGVMLMYSASEGDVDGIREVLESGVSANFRNIDDRTALHVAACQGFADVVDLLLQKGADVDPKDRWGSTPLADAIYYNNNDVIKLLEKHGAKPLMAPMHVNHAREVPEYEIEPKELDFTNSLELRKGTFCSALWRGTEVAVKKLREDVISNEDKVKAFSDELALFQKLRHPNVVQFLGAVTQSSPMMIVTEFLPKGDLHDFLKRKGALRPSTAVRFALDIARGVGYLHENKPSPIIHRDLEPANILRDDSGHLKVADFGVSKLLAVKEDKPLTCQETSCRYVAPEVFKQEEYDTKVDVFSFALILQEMIEGCAPFSAKPDDEVPKVYAAKERPPFRAPAKCYSYGIRTLVEECWNENPAKRPTFRQIITRLESIYNRIGQKGCWKLDIINMGRGTKNLKKHVRTTGIFGCFFGQDQEVQVKPYVDGIQQKLASGVNRIGKTVYEFKKIVDEAISSKTSAETSSGVQSFDKVIYGMAESKTSTGNENTSSLKSFDKIINGMTESKTSTGNEKTSSLKSFSKKIEYDMNSKYKATDKNTPYSSYTYKGVVDEDIDGDSAGPGISDR